MKNAIKLFVLFFALLSETKSFAQSNSANVNKNVSASGNLNWIKFKNKISANSITGTNKNLLGLAANDDFRLIRMETDELGINHYRFQQLYKSIPIEGADFIVHEKDGVATTANGKLVRELIINSTPAITNTAAITTAINYVKADAYMWEDSGAEQMLKRINKNATASFYPKAELVIARNFADESSQYKLAYKVNVFASQPISGQTIYIDAVSGDIIGTLNLIHTTDVPGTAVTKYTGTQTIMVDSVSPTLFRLREYTRGAGVETYNCSQGVKYSTATDFTDTDNYWDTVNVNQDEVATDAHFGAEMTYDYFLQKHNRNSFDNQGTLLISYVHFSKNYVNAFWNGSWMTYGDGNSTYSPLTPLDICGHELAHGVTSKSAGLIYRYESGALNESFSDIFGTAVEFFANSTNANWLIGEQLGNAFRSMSNPNAKSNPDTYKGTHWVTGPEDEGGVHTNSGVQNFWFYLLVNGGTGTNDNGDAYSVTGIGMDAAAKIAYRNLTVYLTTTSQYIDARQGAIWAAEDLYGICSAEAIQTANAWHAVGVGEPISDGDMSVLSSTSPTTACGLTNSENITIKIRYNGCTSIAAGDTIPLGYMINNGAAIYDSIFLVSNLLPGDSLDHTFSTPADLSTVGNYTIKAWVDMNDDTLYFNDSIILNIENILAQNIDVGIAEINSPKKGCQLSAGESLEVKVKFYGCDSLKINDSIVLAYRVDGGIIEKDTMVLNAPLYPNQTVSHIFNKTIDLSAINKYMIDVWTEYSKDTLNTNDSLLGYDINNPYVMDHKLITFEDINNVVDSFYVITNSMSKAFVSTTSKKTGLYGFQMTGDNWYVNRRNYKGVNDFNMWTVNPEFSAKICFCVDATTWSSANLKFDLLQTYNSTYSGARGYEFPFTSSMRLLVNGIQIGNTYNPLTKKSDPYTTHFIDLSAYAGTAFEVCFEGKNYQSKVYDGELKVAGDNTYLDNIYFSENSIIGIDENDTQNTFTVYPNPGKDLFTVTYISKTSEIITIELIDVLGRKIIDMKWNVNSGNNTIPLEIKDQLSGIYIMSIRSNDGVGIKKLIVE